MPRSVRGTRGCSRGGEAEVAESDYQTKLTTRKFGAFAPRLGIVSRSWWEDFGKVQTTLGWNSGYKFTGVAVKLIFRLLDLYRLLISHFVCVRVMLFHLSIYIIAIVEEVLGKVICPWLSLLGV